MDLQAFPQGTALPPDLQPVLAVSAAGRPVEIALRVTSDGEPLRTANTDATTGLVAEVQTLCKNAGLAPTALQGIALDLGPGSYTGLRSAVTWAMLCHRFAGVPIYAATSLEMLALRAARAAAANGNEVPERIHVLLDARRGRAHHGEVERGRDGVWRLARPPAAVPLADLAARIPAGAHALVPASLQDTAPPHTALPDAPDSAVPLSAALFLDPGAHLRPVPSGATLEPLYLMGSYAADPA